MAFTGVANDSPESRPRSRSQTTVDLGENITTQAYRSDHLIFMLVSAFIGAMLTTPYALWRSSVPMNLIQATCRLQRPERDLRHFSTARFFRRGIICRR